MALDDRDYMNTPKGNDPKDVWYRPKEHRSGQRNAEFWSKVQRRNSGPSLGWIIGGVAIAGFACYMYVTGMGPEEAFYRLVGKVQSEMESRQQGVGLMGRTDDGIGTATRMRCATATAPQRMTRRFGQGEGMQEGRYFEFVNGTRGPLFLRVSSGIDGPITQTLILAPGDRVIEPALSPHARLELQTGSRWCNDRDGWEDAQVTKVQGTIAAMAGTTQVRFGSNSDGGIAISVLMPAPSVPRAKAVPSVVEGQMEKAATGIAKQPEEQTRGRGEVEGRRPVFQRSQSEQLAEQERSRLSARTDGVMEKSAAAMAEETGPEAAQRQGVRVQDWRDVPARDIRMVTNGSMHYVGGQVGDEDVQFLLHLGGTSMIGDEMAKRVGASSCRGGQWLVLDKYLVSCKKLVATVTFGGVTLENVLFAVVPGEVTPVLSSDLVGRAKIFKGRDGDYLAVGR